VIQAPSVAPPSPFRGLRAFDESELDAMFFFGREGDTETITANVLAARFAVLFGPPGVGKSSILHAAVVRRVRALVPDALVVVHDSWSGDPSNDLWRAVTSAARVDSPGRDEPLVDRFERLSASLGNDIYLLLDQFEELFTYANAATLTAELSDVLNRSELRVNVLVAVRDDALSELDAFTGRVPDVFGNALPLERLDRAAGEDAITGPIVRWNELSSGPRVAIEPELVEAVLDEVAVGRVALGGVARGAAAGETGRIEASYLQIVMQRLWEADRDSDAPVLRLRALEELGGAQEIIRSHFERAVEALTPQQRDIASRIFNHLVTPSGTKIAHRADDLARYADVDEAELRPVLDALGADRLLRPLDDHVEIFHDVLADAVLAWRGR
jgi:hypothetical protein